MVSSRMFEAYCADIESMVREGTVRPALRLALALPDICTALIDPARKGSGERYAGWCATWLTWQVPSRLENCDGNRLFRIYQRRKSPGGRPNASPTARALSALRKRRAARVTTPAGRARIWPAVGRIQTLEVALSDALVKAARRWYAEVGSRDPIVQRNLGLLAVMR